MHRNAKRLKKPEERAITGYLGRVGTHVTAEIISYLPVLDHIRVLGVSPRLHLIGQMPSSWHSDIVLDRCCYFRLNSGTKPMFNSKMRSLVIRSGDGNHTHFGGGPQLYDRPFFPFQNVQGLIKRQEELRALLIAKCSALRSIVLQLGKTCKSIGHPRSSDELSWSALFIQSSKPLAWTLTFDGFIPPLLMPLSAYPKVVFRNVKRELFGGIVGQDWLESCRGELMVGPKCCVSFPMATVQGPREFSLDLSSLGYMPSFVSFKCKFQRLERLKLESDSMPMSFVALNSIVPAFTCSPLLQVIQVTANLCGGPPSLVLLAVMYAVSAANDIKAQLHLTLKADDWALSLSEAFRKDMHVSGSSLCLTRGLAVSNIVIP